jgi:hypothetical protein
MAKKHLMLVLILSASFLLILNPSRSIASTYGGAWLPNSNDIFTFSWDNSGNDAHSFWLYDWGDTTEELLLFNNQQGNNATIWFLSNGGNWYASFDETQDGSDLFLGPTPEFGFYFYYALNTPQINTTYELNNCGIDCFELIDNQSSPNTHMRVWVHDAAPVPIPSTVWIFGIGILTIVGIRRKVGI